MSVFEDDISSWVFDEDILSCIASDLGDTDGDGLLERRMGNVKTGIVFAILARRFIVRESRHDQPQPITCTPH